MLRDSRTVPRYFLTPALDGFMDGEPVRVIDVGLKGIRIELYASVKPGRTATLVFASIPAQVRVLWCQLDSLNFALEQDQYLAGLVFEQRNAMVEELIELLMAREAAVPIADNRCHDRYGITAPLTGSFGEVGPVSVADLSVRGARISCARALLVDAVEQLRFQVDDETGPVNVAGRVMWCRPSQTARAYEVGLSIQGADEILRRAILRLCMRNEARIDLDSLKRKFDALRLTGTAAVARHQMAV